jgi:ribose 5-phosphate isomerase A
MLTQDEIKQLVAKQAAQLVQNNMTVGIDITIDGADEIDANLQLIKGGGGALLQEKMVAAASRELFILADETKLVQKLGKFPLPLEVIPFGWKQVQRQIKETYHVDATLRIQDDQPFVSDHGHYILDCRFQQIEHPDILTYELNAIPGLVDNGLFVNMADLVLVGYADGRTETLHK